MKCAVIILQLSDKDDLEKNIDDIKRDILNVHWGMEVVNFGGITPNGDEYDVSIMDLPQCNLNAINSV